MFILFPVVVGAAPSLFWSAVVVSNQKILGEVAGGSRIDHMATHNPSTVHGKVVNISTLQCIISGRGTLANFEVKVPSQDVYLLLVMYDNLSPRFHKIQKNPTPVRLFGTPVY